MTAQGKARNRIRLGFDTSADFANTPAMRGVFGSFVLAAGLFQAGAADPSLRQAQDGPPLPDWRLPDVNPHSIRSNSLVSPRDYLYQVSGYYFGAAG